MTLSRIGDDESDIIELPNGMKIYITFSHSENGIWGSAGRLSGQYRRVQLFNFEDELISEVVEINPLYYPDLPRLIIPDDPNIIY